MRSRILPTMAAGTAVMAVPMVAVTAMAVGIAMEEGEAGIAMAEGAAAGVKPVTAGEITIVGAADAVGIQANGGLSSPPFFFVLNACGRHAAQ